jgi:ribosomal protein L17
MVDPETLAQMNGKYACPPGAGPAWRAAMAAGIDMSLIEHALTLTPEQRLAEHQQVIDFLLTLKGAGLSNAE